MESGTETMYRRDFLLSAGTIVIALNASASQTTDSASQPDDSPLITLFLCGDVMTGRGIDQVLPHPNDPRIYEPYVRNAVRYVELAETLNGPIPKPVAFPYIWGDALDVLDRVAPDVRIVNLETAVTSADDYWRGKGINYRMHPRNVPCLTAAKIDCCALANNHVLDWGYSGLAETLETLSTAKVMRAGAGRNREEAAAPAMLDVPGKGRVIVFSVGSVTSGIPADWAADDDRAGVNLLTTLSEEVVGDIATSVGRVKRSGDLVVVSIHWGSNWGYPIPNDHRQFAHRLIDEAGVDVVHGHSSHHPRGIEIYRTRPIVYGCGDFLNDYEGIGGYEEFRGDLSLMYFVSLDPATGNLARMVMTPLQVRRFRLNRASNPDAEWLRDVLSREGRALGTTVELTADNTLILRARSV